jgi:hypothetical protein
MTRTLRQDAPVRVLSNLYMQHLSKTVRASLDP